MLAPSPFAHQCGGEMPSPMNMHANRCGGLRAGDKIITQGTANLRTGAPIQAVPQGAPQKIVPGKPGAGGPGAGRRGAGGG